MEISHNSVFKISDAVCGLPAGLYRVILDEPSENTSVVVLFEPAQPKAKHIGGRKPRNPVSNRRRPIKARLFGGLIWLDRTELEQLHATHEAQFLEVQRAPIYYLPMDNPKVQEIYDRRCKAMESFLGLETLRQEILMHRGLGGLVRQAMASAGVSRAYVYQQWSALCRFGFSEMSLRPRWDRCGGRGKKRDNTSTHPRQKPGMKEPAQRLSKQIYGFWGAPIQPGMNDEWRAKILAADKKIPAPKPAMPERYDLIIDSKFKTGMRYNNDNTLESVELKLGQYPNFQQVKRVLTKDKPWLDQLLEKTTAGHFNRNLRGLKARNWEGVEGPGHTWAIDSTIGDIYLVSEINRSWIVGRPIVYIIVDVWSTAIVGFHVCLSGPSWDTAQISIFNAVANPTLMGNLWGCELQCALFPYPTLPAFLLCDRGEYLSKRAKATGMKLKFDLSYTPPYRPDLKGIVEVLHRINKSSQYYFYPGTMDARRKEYDLRRSSPSAATMTVRDYVQNLYVRFQLYNLTANRGHRVDAHMAAAGVFPSPAGLWRWGHAMGVGYRKASTQEDLITQLLPQAPGRVTRQGVKFLGNEYLSPIVEEQQWSTVVRNSNQGGWDIPIRHYPGSVSKIWTPNSADKGLIDLTISDQANASPELSYEEVQDAWVYQQLQAQRVEHQRTLERLKGLQHLRNIRDTSIEKTRIARERALKRNPSISEARIIERNLGAHFSTSEIRGPSKVRDEAEDAHQALMQSIFNEMNQEGEDA